MKLNSIRWQLPLSYAAIALVAALALGGVLLSILRNYYAGVESRYLTDNALTVASYLVETGALEGPPAALQSDLEAFAFLTRARIRLTDLAGRTLADTGQPEDQIIELGDGPAPGRITARVDVTVTGAITTEQSRLFIRSFPGGVALSAQAPDLAGAGERFGLGDGTPDHLVMPFGPDFAGEAGGRSEQRVRVGLASAGGSQGAYVELSEGPAYGREILRSVAWGWAVAGAFALLLATVTGWLVSRRISGPVLALAAATERMAQGDLTARAPAAPRVRELDALARSFNEMADGIEGTMRTLRRFVSDAAHQLQTPLTALRTDLELALGDEADERQAARLRRGQGQAERLQTLADELLELSQVEAGARATCDEVVDLGQLVRSAAESQASRAEQAGIALDARWPEARLRVAGRATELRALVDNLLDNALKFTPAGGAVTVELRAEGDQAVLTVRDTGIGIAAEDLPALFSRFHRGRNAAAYPGNGLGLAIVKAVAEAHGGQVRAEATTPGSAFAATLPLWRPDETEEG